MFKERNTKFVNVRSYLNYLEASISQGILWTVFEPNDDSLWINIRECISAFLLSEWRKGALVGTKPEEAYFVRCDRSTMTQGDIDQGLLICIVGVAIIKPSEYEIIRITQKTLP